MSSATPRRDGNDHDRAACNAGDALSTTTQCTPTRSSGSTARSKTAHCNVRVVSTHVLWSSWCCCEPPGVKGVPASRRRTRSSWCRPRSVSGSRPLTEGRRTVRTSTPRRRDCGRCPPPRATSSSGAWMSHCKRFIVMCMRLPVFQVSETSAKPPSWKTFPTRRAATAPEPMSLHTNLGPDAVSGTLYFLSTRRRRVHDSGPA